jgi:cystathionine beta-synthase
MRDREFISKEKISVLEMIVSGKLNEVITVSKDQKVEEIVELFTKNGISQIPVTDGKNIVGSITDNSLYPQLIANPALKTSKVEELMGAPFQFVNVAESLESVSSQLNRENPALLTRAASGKVYIITKQDVIQALC